jgi:hypothetical protein
MNKLIYTHIQKLHALVLEVTDESWGRGGVLSKMFSGPYEASLA